MKLLLKNAIIKGVKQNLLINNEYIAYIGNNYPENDKEIDLNGNIILPGIIDPHTHIRDLDQTHKEDWASASKAAIRGGITMVFDMPNNQPPTINLHNLDLKRKKALIAKINYRFNIAATSYNLKDIKEILATQPQDVVALKMFLAGSNSKEYTDKIKDIKNIFSIAKNYDIPVIVHSELQECINRYSGKITHPKVTDHNYLRNRECAIEGTELLLKLVSEIGNKLYIAHVSVAEEIDLIRDYKHKANVYCEITPHHLLLNENILTKVGNFGKVNPPLRTKKDNIALWKGVQDGTVDTIGTDHAPHTLNEKLKPYIEVPSGFPGLETNLPLLLNEVNNKNLTIKQLIQLTSAKTSEIFKIKNRGKLDIGYYADLAIVDLQKKWTINPKGFYTKAKYSPFKGMQGSGDVIMTFVNGKLMNHTI